jgi:uncharacterized protein
MWQVTWTIKATKLCNLRCRYCYEWPQLADPSRIQAGGWRRILAAAKEYHLRQTGAEAAERMTQFVWHGGEPLCLPVAYWRDVIALQREVLHRDTDCPIRYRNAVQTNLFDLSPAYLDLFAQEDIFASVSFDHAPGTRVTKRGRPTEDRVIENMRLLRERNIRFGAAVVLAGHNRDCLIATYDVLKAAGACQITVIPLRPADHFSTDAPFAISTPQVVEALKGLYEYWSSDSRPIPIIPLAGYLRTVWLHALNLPARDFDRGAAGERRLIVDTAGDLYVRAAQYGAEHRLGNLFRQTLSEIMHAAPYADSLGRDKHRRAQVCGACVYRQACDTRPALESADAEDGALCPVAAPLCEFIAAYLSLDSPSRPGQTPGTAGRASKTLRQSWGQVS